MQPESGNNVPPSFSASKQQQAASPTIKPVPHQLSQKQLPAMNYSPMKARPSPIITIQNTRLNQLNGSSSQVVVGQQSQPASPAKSVKPAATPSIIKPTGPKI